MLIESEVLSRIQFALSISFHILFPTLNLGLALFLVYIEGRYLWTKKILYLHMAQYWTKIFALTFGMGVVTGVAMSYQLGTNFSHFAEKVGPLLGPLLGYEVMSAFFLEAGFLGIMLFGWKKVTPRAHFVATCLVWLGTTVSAFWIMSANSWMQTPKGFHLVDGVFHVTSWVEAIFNPSFPTRLLHMLLAAYVSTAFFIMAVAAFHMKHNIQPIIAKKTLTLTAGVSLIVCLAQIGMGDLVGLMVHKHQPLKTAAMEGLWETTRGADLVLFAWPDQASQSNHYSISIPKLASFLNTHEWEGQMIGLKSVPRAEQPLVSTVFFTFRIMVGIGFLLLFVALGAVYLLWRGRLYRNKTYLNILIGCAPLGFIATLTGWFVSETGRQPFVVYGLMTTKEAASPVAASSVLFSLGLFILTYGLVFSAYLFYLRRLVCAGPKLSADIHPPAYTYITKELTTE